MNLTIDIGNTRAKIILFDNNKPVYEEILSEDLEQAIIRIYQRFHPQQCAWCNVGRHENLAKEAIRHLPCPSVQLTGLSEVPVNVCYRSRKTLGADRLAAVLGATEICPDKDLLIIDAGTCITYDLVDARGNYLGGNISPGLDMRLKALHHFTASLPEVNEVGELPKIGDNTETALRCGVVQGLIYEIEGYITHLEKEYPHILTFLTGGSKLNLSDTIKGNILTDPYLVARGLNRLLNH